MPLVPTTALPVGEMSKSSTVPEGTYHIRCAKAEIKAPSDETIAANDQKGKDSYEFVNFDMVIVGTEANPEAQHGRHVFDNCTLAPSGNFALRQAAEAAGIGEEEDIIDAINAGRFTDAEFYITVAVEKEGKGRDGKVYPERNKVTKRSPLV